MGIKASPNDIPNRGPSRFSVPYMVAAKKGALLDTSLEPNYNLLFKNDSNVTENENAKNDAPIEVGDFLWQCTLAYAQENEQSIMKRYDIKKQSKPL